MIKFALTPQQWAERGIYVATREGGEEPQRLLWTVEDKDGVLTFKTGCGGGSAVGFTRHAIAALSLHEQPFGFSWADVDELLSLATALDSGDWGSNDSTGLRSIASRIAALLPPR